MNIENLLDVVESQLCIYGNRALFVRNMESTENDFMLFSGETSDMAFFECTNKDGADISAYGLQALSEMLQTLNGNDSIYCSDDSRVLSGFQLGFKAEGRFVLTLDSTELVRPTVLQ